VSGGDRGCESPWSVAFLRFHRPSSHRTGAEVRSTSSPSNREMASFHDATSGDDEHERQLQGDGALTLDQAYAILSLPDSSKGNLEHVKAAYRKLCLKWHPDKNPSDKQEEAKHKFTRITAAYHTITTNNFDYERWAATYSIPPMQTLEDVLKMALSGRDPFEIEAVLRARGDYRPNAQFGVDVRVPWTAGTRPDPTFNVHTGSGYNTTRKLGFGTRASDVFALPPSSGLGGDSSRPWETVGGVGFEDASLFSPAAPGRLTDADGSGATRIGPKNARPDVSPESLHSTEDERREIHDACESLNEEGLEAFKQKDFARAIAAYDECLRLRPTCVAYLGNRAAACLKMRGQRRFFQRARDDCALAVSMDPSYVRGWVRLGQACFLLGDDPDEEDRFDVALLREAESALEKALALDQGNAQASKVLKEVRVSLQLYDDDDDDDDD